MKYLLFCCLYMISAQPVIIAQSKVKRQLESLERQRFEAMTKTDIPFLQNVLADELTYSHSSGVVETKSEFLQSLKSGNLVYKVIKPEKIEVRVYKNTALLTGVFYVTVSSKGKELNARMRYLDVYVKKERRWQLVAWQSVRAE